MVDFVRKLQWRSTPLRFRDIECRFGVPHSSRWPAPALVPPNIRTLCARILSASRQILFSHTSCFPNTNLTPSESVTLQSLISNSSIIVRPSDKGGRWVITCHEAFREECLRQLRDTNFYQPLPRPLFPLPPASLDATLQSLLSRGYLSKRELRCLSSGPRPRSRHFKALPKLHKEVWPTYDIPPVRPVISDVNTDTSGIARLIDYFLFPLVSQLKSFLLDSSHLLALLQPLSLEPHSLLCTLDVRSLYTNVPIDEGLRRVARAFRRFPNDRRPDSDILRLLEYCLLSNDFSFENTWWLQTKGVAMGKAFGGSFAGLYLGEWESSILCSSPLSPRIWLRFQDDVFMVWDHGQTSLSLFLQHVNAQDPSIQVDLHSSPSSVRFLDLELYRSDPTSSILRFRVAFKETHSFALLPSSSHHPPHVHRGVVFAEVLRWATHSSTREDFDSVTHTVFPLWRAQGVSRSLVRRSLSHVLRLTQLVPAWEPGFTPCSSASCSVCSLASPHTTFSSPHLPFLFRIPFHLSCSSTHCIYYIFCTAHPVFYIGKTVNQLRSRITQHLRNIRNTSHTSSIASHFRTCSPSNFRFFAFDRALNGDALLVKEERWIRRLKATLTPGLNRVTHSQQHPINLLSMFSPCSSRLNNVIRNLCSSQNTPPVRISYRTDQNLSSLLR